MAGGVSYTEAAARVRRRAWGHAGAERRAETPVASGQTVADRLSTFGPAVLTPYAEQAWPRALQVDVDGAGHGRSGRKTHDLHGDETEDP